MKIRKTEIPEGTLIKNYLPADHTDTYVCESDKPIQASPDDIMIRLWSDFPAWLNILFRLRNFLVKFVGLKTEKKDTDEFERLIRNGGELGFVSVPEKNDKETILLLKDKHLNAYLSVYVDNKQNSQDIYAITLVHFHNRFGRVYFFFIRPFHDIIVKSILRQTVKSFISP